jgi:hypothetical protein
MDTPEQQTFLERILAAHITRSRKKRSPLPDLPRANLSLVPGTSICMRNDAAIAAGKLLASANRDLDAAKAAGEPDALKTVRISATSGYRPRAHQEQLWRKYFGSLGIAVKTKPGSTPLPIFSGLWELPCKRKCSSTLYSMFSIS